MRKILLGLVLLLTPLCACAQISIIATDTMNRANGSLGANWNCLNIPTGQGNQFPTLFNQSWTNQAGILGQGMCRWIGAGSFSANQYSGAVISVPGLITNECQVGASVRMSTDGQSAYFMLIGPNNFVGNNFARELWKVVNGTFTQLGANIAGPVIAGETFEVRAQGSIIQGLDNNVPLWTVIDTSIATGSPGIYAVEQGVVGDAQTCGARFWQAGNSTILKVLVSDNFTRANGGVGPPWINQLNSLLISSNQVTGSNAADNNFALYNVPLPTGQWASLTNAGFSGGFSAGPTLRSSGTTSSTMAFYRLTEKQSGGWVVQQLTGNSALTIGQDTVPATSVGDVLTLVMSSHTQVTGVDTLWAFINGTLVGPTTGISGGSVILGNVGASVVNTSLGTNFQAGTIGDGDMTFGQQLLGKTQSLGPVTIF